MRHVGDGQIQPLLQGADFLAHFAPQTGVKIGKRLVKEQHARLQHQRARQGHALLLSARQFAGHALVVAHQPDALQGLDSALTGFVLALSRHAQAVHHVFHDVHVRKERVALEHHAHIAFGRPEGGDIAAIHENLPARA